MNDINDLQSVLKAKLAEKLEREKAILKPDLARAGVQLVFLKLMAAAETLPERHIKSRDPAEQLRMQAMYDVLHYELPRVMETIMNSDFDLLSTKTKWSFWGWLLKK